MDCQGLKEHCIYALPATLHITAQIYSNLVLYSFASVLITYWSTPYCCCNTFQDLLKKKKKLEKTFHCFSDNTRWCQIVGTPICVKVNKQVIYIIGVPAKKNLYAPDKCFPEEKITLQSYTYFYKTRLENFSTENKFIAVTWLLCILQNGP